MRNSSFYVEEKRQVNNAERIKPKLAYIKVKLDFFSQLRHPLARIINPLVLGLIELEAILPGQCELQVQESKQRSRNLFKFCTARIFDTGVTIMLNLTFSCKSNMRCVYTRKL